MLQDQMAHLVRELMKTSDLGPDESDLIWQWLEQIKVVGLWAGLNRTIAEEDLAADKRPLGDKVKEWLHEPGGFTLSQRIAQQSARKGRRRPLLIASSIAMGEGDIR